MTDVMKFVELSFPGKTIQKVIHSDLKNKKGLDVMAGVAAITIAKKKVTIHLQKGKETEGISILPYI
jgi:hypothetical protein